MPKLERDSRAYLDQFRLIVGIREERAAAGHPRDLLEDRTSKAGKRIIDRIRYPDSVDLNVGFLHSVAQLFVCITAVVILTVRDYQQRFLVVAPLLDLLNTDVCCVVKRG